MKDAFKGAATVIIIGTVTWFWFIGMCRLAQEVLL